MVLPRGAGVLKRSLLVTSAIEFALIGAVLLALYISVERPHPCGRRGRCLVDFADGKRNWEQAGQDC